MAELTFFTGPMNCGKSTLALQVDHTEASAGRSGRLFTCLDRSGGASITSRVGLSSPATDVDPDFDFWAWAQTEYRLGHALDYVICDEVQFYTRPHIDQLARIVDDLGIDVYCFGITTDFRSELFPPVARLIELCDRMETLPIRPRCWCGAWGTKNARVKDGIMVTEGAQVEVGDTESGGVGVHYEVVCRRHHRLRLPSTRAGAAHEVPLPFDDPTPA